MQAIFWTVEEVAQRAKQFYERGIRQKVEHRTVGNEAGGAGGAGGTAGKGAGSAASPDWDREVLLPTR
jgi:hypothetical protein